MARSRRTGSRSRLLAVVPLVGFGMVNAALPAQASAGRIAIAGGLAEWTAHSASLGRPAAESVVGFDVYLAPRGGEKALEAAVAAVSTPGSAGYRHFVSVAQYRAAYAPTDAEVAAVTAWLRSNGLDITGVEAAHRYVSVRGTVAVVENALDTSLATYRHNGQLVTAPSVPASVPDTIADSVLGVAGLDTTQTFARPSLTPPPPAFANARPCSQYYGQLLAQFKADGTTPLPKFNGAFRDYAVCGYTPSQLRSAYEGNTPLAGSGVTVAITDAYAAGTILSDANTFATTNGDPGFATGQFTQRLASNFTQRKLCGPSGWAGEETLDVEAVHGMAPAANVVYYGAKSCLDFDLLSALERVADDNTASIVTNSWGDLGEMVPKGEVVAYDQVFHQDALQGISVLFSSGDNGDELASTGTRQTDFPAAATSVTAVGGTTTQIDQNGALAGQTGWGTQKFTLSPSGERWLPVAANPFIYGSGGGFSRVYERPSYQAGVVPDSHSGRAVPDVAMDGDPTTGMRVGETQLFPDGTTKFSEYRIGGTSVASPLFAGMTALAIQNAGSRVGFLNPVIYGQARNHAGTFTDVLPSGGANVRPDFINGVDAAAGIAYSVRTFDHDSSLVTTRGWDEVTGLGTPNAGYLTSL